ncbi:MAG: cytochrome c peroxidase [Myxococcota bacterium]
MHGPIPHLALLIAAGCRLSGGPAPAPGVWTATERTQLERMRPADLPPVPSNPWADRDDAAALGQALFFDPALSASGAFSCASCHKPGLGFADPAPHSVAAGTTKRHTPVIPGSQRGPYFGWTGDSDSMWAQAIGPLLNPLEMASTPEHVAQAVASGHSEAYASVFGVPPDPAEPEKVLVKAAQAIEAYERRLIPEPSRFDRYLETLGGPEPTPSEGVLSESEIRGLSLFLRDADCIECHHGPMLTDGAFHNLAVAEPYGYDKGRTEGAHAVTESKWNCRSPHAATADCGELDFLNPDFEDFEGAFKTPTLRNVARTAPYFHNGSIPDLAGVIAFYNELPGDAIFGHRELTLHPLELDAAEQADLIAFLHALDAEVPAPLREPPVQD